MSQSTHAASGNAIPLIHAHDIHGTRALRSGAFIRVTRGVYAAAGQWAVLPPWEKYRVRVRAAGLKHPDGVYFLESAAAAHGLPIFGDPVDVHVLDGSLARSRESGGVIVHTTTDERSIQSIDGMLVPDLADTVVDIARARHPAIGLAVADAALRRDPTLTVEQLMALNESRSSSRGRRRARWALHRATSLAESPLESVDRAVIEWLGFPDPQLQVWIGADRVDKWWPAFRIAGEGDGDLKYGGTREQSRQALRERHERDARLFGNGAAAVPHWGWSETLAVEPLHAILRSAGLPVVQTRDTPLLFSLRRAMNHHPS